MVTSPLTLAVNLASKGIVPFVTSQVKSLIVTLPAAEATGIDDIIAKVAGIRSRTNKNIVRKYFFILNSP